MSCKRTITLACIFFQVIPLGTLINAILCPFCKLKPVLAIWMKLHTVVEHNGKFVCLFFLLYVPCQQLWSLLDGQFT